MAVKKLNKKDQDMIACLFLLYKPKQSKVSKALKWCVYGTLSLALAIIMALVLFCQNDQYYGRKEFLLPNIVLLLIAAVLFIGLTVASKRIKLSFLNRKDYRIINILSIILFIGLIYIALNIHFYPGWDAGTVMKGADSVSDTMFTEKAGSYQNRYFSAHTNQQALLLVESILVKIGKLFGVAKGDDHLMIVIAFQCLLMVTTGNLLFRIIHKKTASKKMASIGYLLFFILLALSGWVYVPYTDGMAVCLPILIYYIYLKKEETKKHELLWWALIGVLSYFGYKMKPTVLIILIAILAGEIIYGLQECTKKKLVKMVKGGIVLALSIFVSMWAFNALFKITGVEINKNYDHGVLHMLMMGLNDKTDGRYLKTDVDISESFGEDVAGRKAAQKEVIMNRLNEYGFSGLMNHTKKKTMVIFNDGTFAWGNEGCFYCKIYPNRNKKMGPFLRDTFYSTGKKNRTLATIQHATWLLVIALCLFVVFMKKDKNMTILVIALIGIIVFNLLFEARARYLYVYVPIFIVVASSSLNQIGELINNRLMQHLSHKSKRQKS